MNFLFDLDGTLIDSTPAILASMSAALRSEGLDASDEFIKSQIGAPLDVMMREFGCQSEAQMMRLLSAYKAHYGQIYLEQTTLLPGALEAVRLAATAGRAAVVTTKTGAYARELCRALGLSAAGLCALIGGDEVAKRTKPDAAPIYAAISDIAQGVNSAAVGFCAPERAEREWWCSPAELAAELAHTYMIGDTLNDTRAAAAAGVRCCVSEFIYTPASAFSGVEVFKTPLECVEFALKENK